MKPFMVKVGNTLIPWHQVVLIEGKCKERPVTSITTADGKVYHSDFELDEVIKRLEAAHD